MGTTILGRQFYMEVDIGHIHIKNLRANARKFFICGALLATPTLLAPPLPALALPLLATQVQNTL